MLKTQAKGEKIVMKKIYATSVYLSANQWLPLKDKIVLCEPFWDLLLKKSSESGINAIMIEVGDGVKYESHPEISLADAWDREKVKKEVARCKTLGIEIIPRVNFSSTHNFWMKKYRSLTSTPEYYDFCSDIIKEIYEIFEHPQYIHIGMDEEDAEHQKKSDLVIFRRGSLLMNDMKFLIDEVNKTGAKPIISHCSMFVETEKFFKMISPDEVVIEPWWYYAFYRDKLTPVSEWAEKTVEKELAKECVEMGLVYMEDHPFLKPLLDHFYDIILPAMKMGYKYIPMASIWGSVPSNHEQMLDFFENAEGSEDSILGYFTVPWTGMSVEYIPAYEESFRQLMEAKKIHIDGKQ